MSLSAPAATCGLHYSAMTVRATWEADPSVEGELGTRRMAITLYFDGILPEGEWDVEHVKLRCLGCERPVELFVR